MPPVVYSDSVYIDRHPIRIFQIVNYYTRVFTRSVAVPAQEVERVKYHNLNEKKKKKWLISRLKIQNVDKKTNVQTPTIQAYP